MASLTSEPNHSATLTLEAQRQARRTMLMGCPVDLLTSAALLTELSQAIDSQGGPKVIQFINANKIAQVRQDSDMGRIMRKADYVLTDGQPLVPMARLLGVKVPERIDGIGLMGKLLKLADERRYSVYLLGAKQEVLDTCVAKIRKQGATVIQGVGGSFDVMADLVKRAPVWVQRIGMEWMFRVIQEPRRMFWRYTTTNATCLSVFGRAFFMRLAGRR
jgi:N-acetylglucosaminyldiphosphoundecaprenol N-acetyl-beta-D-mannosaminyltransferase